MVQLVLVFCMLASPNSCKEERPMLEGMTLSACMVQSQQIASTWLADHPNWSLARWRCENNIPKQKQI
jgi:hypothetical protein